MTVPVVALIIAVWALALIAGALALYWRAR